MNVLDQLVWAASFYLSLAWIEERWAVHAWLLGASGYDE